MSAASQKPSATGKLRAQLFRRAARFEIAISVRKTNYSVGIRHVQKLRIIARRIKRHPEWLVEIALGKNPGHVRFTRVLCVAQNFDLICAAFRNKNIAARRGQQKTRFAKATRVHINLETGWNM